jgi:CDP-6-deoxy-D-xylo-4-hexulose-3-dehydrase
MQAAVGLAQLERLPGFIEARRRNFRRLRERLAPLEEHLILPEPTPGSDPAWFGFPLTVRRNRTDLRVRLQEHLERHRIGSRLLFGGNLTRQPYFQGRRFRVAGSLENTDKLMNDALWIGVYPGLSEDMLDYVAERIGAFFAAAP